MQGCRLHDNMEHTDDKLEPAVIKFLGLCEVASDCIFGHNNETQSMTELGNVKRLSGCKNCADEYKNLSSHFMREIVSKAKTKDDICNYVLERVCSFVS